MQFLDRLQKLPWLGLGVYSEYGAGSLGHGLDILRLHAEQPALLQFLEIRIGVELGLEQVAWQ